MSLPIVWSTAYDVFSAHVCEESGVDTILVGDSLGMTVYGLQNTQEVTKELMFPHVKAVCSSVKNTPVVVDFPFQCDKDVLTAVETAEFFANAGVEHFKIEGSAEHTCSAIIELLSRNFFVTGHLGLTPQICDRWELQGKTTNSAQKIFSDAQQLEQYGVSSIVLECVPEILGKKIQESLSIPVIGIGAGRYTQGQVLVFDDIVGKTSADFSPRFLERFGDVYSTSHTAMKQYVTSVQEKKFPRLQHVY